MKKQTLIIIIICILLAAAIALSVLGVIGPQGSFTGFSDVPATATPTTPPPRETSEPTAK